MAEETKTKIEKEVKKEVPVETKKEDKVVPKSVPESTNEGKDKKEVAPTQEKEAPKKKKEVSKPVVKEKAIANAYSLRISLKHSKFICKMIKGKTPDQAIEMLANVVKKKQPVKMTGLEVGHQKGKGIAGARFPRNASLAISDVIKQLKANAVVNGIEEPVITVAMPNQASAPMKKGGRKAKRAHLHLEVQDKIKLIEKSRSKKSKKSGKGGKK